MKQALFIGAIASILTINSVIADTTVTSRNYVDTQDALKQDKITAGTTGNVVTYNGTQNGQAQFSERGIFNFETDWDDENGEIVSGHEGDLLDAGSIVPGLYNMGNTVQSMGDALQGKAGDVITYDENGFAGGARGIYDGSTTYDSSTDADKLVTASVVLNVANNMPTTTTTNKVCTEWVANAAHTDANCLLWDLIDQTVYGEMALTPTPPTPIFDCKAAQEGCNTNTECCSRACGASELSVAGFSGICL